MRIRHADTDPPQESLVGVGSDEYPDSAVVDLAEHGPWPILPNRLVRARYMTDTGQMVSLQIVAPWSTGAPALRYVEVSERDLERPAHTLVAFLADDSTRGSVHDAADFAALGLDSADQVGAIRWYPASGLIHQIYVSPAHRRNRIATTLVMAAAGVRVARGWPALHADGRRTDHGEAFQLSGPSQWRHRVAERTEVMPPMTPGD